MAFAILNVTVSAQGAISQLGAFSASASNAGRSTEKFERSTRALAQSLGTLGGLMGIRQLVEYADTWTLINSRVKMVTSSNDQATVVQERLYNIAQRTRNTLNATAVLYTRLALNADQLGRSHEDLLNVVSAVNSAILVSGSTGVEAAQSIRQLAQALGSGRVQGDEFRTMMEAMPMVARAVADEMGVAMGDLYKLSAAGKINVQIVIDALLKAEPKLKKLADAMPVTIGQGMVIFVNALTRLVGIVNLSYGASVTLADGLRWLSKNLDHIIALIGSAITAWISYRTWTLSAAMATALFTAASSIKRWWDLIFAVRSLAAVMYLANAGAKGLLGLLTVVATLTISYIAYKKILGEITSATEEWIKKNSVLSAILGTRKDPEEDAAAAARRLKAMQESADMIREAHQRVVLAGLEGDAAERLEIQFKAVNKAIEARRELEGEVLRVRLNAIAVEERLSILAYDTEQAIKKAAAAAKERLAIIERFTENFQRGFADTFENVLNDGIKKFTDLFDMIKRLFFRMLADIAAANLMQRFGTSLSSVAGAAFGTNRAAAMAQEQAAAASRAALGYLPGTGLAANAAPVPVTIEGITVTASRSWASQIAQFIGPALGGFIVGRLIGSMTTNRALGAAGGAAGGAAAGAAIGTYLMPGVGTAAGAVAGGIAGFVGGLLGASAAAERLRLVIEKQHAILATNNQRLEDLKRSFEGQTNVRFKEFFNIDIIQRLLKGPAIVHWDELSDTDRSMISRMAAEAGITLLDEQGYYISGATRQLINFTLETIHQMTTFGQSLDELQSKQDAYNALFDVKDTPTQKLTDAYSILSELAPDLMQQLGLQNLDLTTSIGRQVLLEGLREIYNMIQSGDLTLELLGAFTDKNQLLQTILRVNEGLEAFAEQLTKVTTDFPRAMDIIYYEQKFGRYSSSTPTGREPPEPPSEPNTPPKRPGTYTADATTGGFVVQGDINIVNQGNETGEEILAKIESAAQRRRTRGGRVRLTDEAIF